MCSDVTAPQRLIWTPELVTRFWDGMPRATLDAFAFARTGGPQLALAARPHLTQGGRHLDFGAGDGAFARLLIEAGFPTVAVEPAAERRAVLERDLHGLGGFLGTDAEAHAPFDAVILSEVIEHLLDQDIDPVLRSLHGFLRPGGRLIVTTPHAEDLDLSMVYCPVSNMLFHRWQHVRSITTASLEAMLARHGFRIVVVHLVDFSPFGFGLPPDRVRMPRLLRRVWHALRARQLARRFASGRPVRLGDQSHIMCVAERA